MYKFLLCWRYLRTRYIALASIVSVTLGVATMIVVNSVMSGFSHEMQDRIHGILSDIVFESHGLEGFTDAEWHMQRIREVAGDSIQQMTPTVHVPAMLNFRVRQRWITRQINFIGIDAESYVGVSDSAQYLIHPENRKRLTFDLREGGYDVRHYEGGPDAARRVGAEEWGWSRRRRVAEIEEAMRRMHRRSQLDVPNAATESEPALGSEPSGEIANGDAQPHTPGEGAALAGGVEQDWGALEENDTPVFNKATQQNTGIVMGIAMAGFHAAGEIQHFLTTPGDDVKITFPTAGTPPRAVSGDFTIVDFYESKMSEYDSAFVFVPIRRLQEMRGMIDPTTGAANVTAIQIKLKPGTDLNAVRDRLRAAFPPEMYNISTWRDKQGPLLAAVQMETAILNILLFLIIAVAGFGILAIFFMIVVEKTKDIGILKSLGASGRGVMSIFLSYGLSLGTVGATAGLVLGLLFVDRIDAIRRVVERMSGRQIFDPNIYYFQQIPTSVHLPTLAWIVGGAILIAVTASVLPALRAARLHPVEALRYE